MVAMTRLRISPWEPAGAGRCTLTMVPGGALTSMGRNEPWLSGAAGSKIDFMAMKTDAAVTAAVELTGNGTCGEAPVKSAVMRSPATVSASGSNSGSKLAAHVGLEIVLEAIDTVGQAGDAGAHPRFRAVEIEPYGLEQRIDAVAAADFVDALLRDPAGGQARLQVAHALFRHAHVGQQDIEHTLVEAACLLDLDRRDAHALLIDLVGLARHAARHHAADVGPVRAHRRKEDQATVLEDRERSPSRR